jgi:hypothetical protein
VYHRSKNDSIASTIQKETTTTTTTEDHLLGEVTIETEQQSVTEFKDAIEPEKVIAAVNAFTEPADELSSLKRFLAKPRKVRSITAESLTPTLFTNVLDFNLFFLLNAISTKLFNYAGIRFTMCTRIAVNTTPFDSGMVAIIHTPPAAITKIATTVTKDHFMKFPHATIDLGEQTAAELRVPFYSPLRYIEVSKVQTPNYLGNFQISDPFDNCFVSNSTLVNIYMWIEDVELLYPTNISGTAFKVWTPQGPAKKDPNGIDVVLSQIKIDNNYQVTQQAVPYAMNCVSKEYKTGSTDTFEELFQTPDFIRSTVLTKNSVMDASTLWVAPMMGDNQYSRMGSLVNFFLLYSGSIDVHMKILKTQFHSGRLQIAFLPLWPNKVVPDSWDDFWNIIWDFSEKSEIEFSIPYVENKFMSLSNVNGSQGILAYRQITPLQCPDNVAQNITLVVTANMSSDLNVACPHFWSAASSVRQPIADIKSDSINTKLYEPEEDEGIEMDWEPQGPPSIADKPSPTPENFVNEGTCSLKDFAGKYSHNVGRTRFSVNNQIVFPSSLLTSRWTYYNGNPNVSNLNLLAHIFEFYRGDLVTQQPVDGGTNAQYYQAMRGVFPENGGTALAKDTDPVFVIPYVSNLKYNSSTPRDFVATDYNENDRLQNAEFFLPWYGIPHRAGG